ncbi:hypothetical protein BURPS1710A_A1773 [Burkholderia pseudomallei 1710a]|uniref:Uncharacterized protein n=1 Tax=Burkholderia pseudomallei 1710a TaxID=320371 RepID=A0A0E1VZD8_BURPE|nr:hypothetical protein BURPS1710A_A1773 [Burkholderia pseudomallei 1710a]
MSDAMVRMASPTCARRLRDMRLAIRRSSGRRAREPSPAFLIRWNDAA